MDCECTKNEKIDCQASKGLKGYRMGGDGVTKYCSLVDRKNDKTEYDNVCWEDMSPPSNWEGEHQYENDEKEDDGAKGRREDVELRL